MKKIGCLFLILCLISSCNKPMSKVYPEELSERKTPVYLIRNGWHTGIALEKFYLDAHLPDHPKIPNTKYLMFGWGDGKYYPHPDPGTGLLLRAALLPTQSVLHIVGVDIPVQSYFPSSRVVRIMIHPTGAKELAEFIGQHFETDKNGDPIFTADGLYQTSAFFQAKPAYFFPRTSNRWVAQAPRRTGYPVTPFYALTAGNLMKQASKYGEVVQ